MKKMLLALFMLSILGSYAQLPDTDIWLLSIKNNEDGTIILTDPVNITNRAGYDNQPSFTPDNKSILFSSNREGQTDIFNYNILSQSLTQLTKTPESEYSPMIMPDGANISVVKVEKDSSQRLWKFPSQGGAQSLILEKVDSIGYYTWINKDSLAFYIISNPSTLQITNIHTLKSNIIVNNIGKGLQMHTPNDCLYFVNNDTTKGQWKGIYTYYFLPKSGPTFYHLLKGGNEFFSMSSIGLITAKDSILYQEFKDPDSPWKELINLSNWGIHNISRITISPDGKKAAIVNAN